MVGSPGNQATAAAARLRLLRGCSRLPAVAAITSFRSRRGVISVRAAGQASVIAGNLAEVSDVRSA